MTRTCGGCGRFIAATDSGAARCHKCAGVYHRRCVALPTSGAIAPTWHCPECKKHRATDNKAETPVRGCSVPATGHQNAGVEPMDCASGTTGPDHRSPPISVKSHIPATETMHDVMSEIWTELRIFRDNLRDVNRDLQSFKDEVALIRQSLHDCQSNLKTLDDRVTVLEKREPLDRVDKGDIIEQLREEINNRDQELLANDIEIANLPEVGGESCINLTLQIAVKLGVQLEERDIVSAERAGPRHIVSTDAGGPERRPRPLAVRLARRSVRDELLAAARVRRGATSADLGLAGPPRRFYLNERLTWKNRQLFRRVREAAQKGGWKFVWYTRGCVLERKNEGDKALNVRNEADLHKVFGHD